MINLKNHCHGAEEKENVVEDLNHMTHYNQHMGLVLGLLKVVAEENLESLEDLDVKLEQIFLSDYNL
jgi:hypothetical protein